ERVARGDASKLTHEAGAAPPDRIAQRARVIGEVEKRRRRRELLSLKEQRRARREQPERRHRPVHSGTGAPPEPLAVETWGVGDLVVVFQEGHEPMRLQTASGRAAPLLLPR